MVDDPEAVRAAFAAGINAFFISADLHWPLYEGLRRGLAELLRDDPSARERMVIGVCSYTTQTEFPLGAMREVLTAVPELGTIDLAIAGGAYGHEILDRLKLFQRLRREQTLGIRAIGASFHDRQAALLAHNHGLLDLVFMRFNALHTRARQEVFPHLDPSAGTLLYNFTNTAGYVKPEQHRSLGLPEPAWWPSPTDHYRFVLSHPQIDGLLCSPRTPAEVAGLVAALEAGPLSGSEQSELIALALRYYQARSTPARD
jgi:hypothetical protein